SFRYRLSLLVHGSRPSERSQTFRTAAESPAPRLLRRQRQDEERHRTAQGVEGVAVHGSDGRRVAALGNRSGAAAAAAETAPTAKAAAPLRVAARGGVRRLGTQIPSDAVQAWRRLVAAELQAPHLLAVVVGDVHRELLIGG